MPAVDPSIREKASASILGRIRGDEKRADANPKIRDLLHFFRRNLFDSNLTTSRAYKTCDIQPKSFIPVFRDAMGDHPQAYLIARRVEIGAELLLSTGYDVYDIGQAVGFGSGQAFSGAFLRTMGIRPSAFRLRYRTTARLPNLDPELCEQIELLNENEAREIRERLATKHPKLQAKKPPLRYQSCEDDIFPEGEHGVTDRALEKILAERLWLKIQGMQHSAQLKEIRDASHFKTYELFEFLKLKSVELSRKDRSLGLDLAWLAFEAATVLEPLNRGRGILQARAWAWVANAQRLLYNHVDAARSLSIASDLLPLDAPSVVKGEIELVQAALNWYQHELSDGLDAVNKALFLFEESGSAEMRSSALVMRGIIRADSNEFPAAVNDWLEVLLEDPAKSSGSSLSLFAYYNLAYCHWKNRDFKQAWDMIRNLKRLINKGDHFLIQIHINALEGRLCLDQQNLDQANIHLENAYSGFQSIESKAHGLIALDIAVLNHLKGNKKKSSTFLCKAMTIIKIWREQPGLSETYAKLREAIATQQDISLDDLLELQDACDQLSHTPRTRALMGLRGLA